MTTIGIWPFYSQQNKATGVHRLDTCGAAKQLGFLADRMQVEFGWSVRIAMPHEYQGTHPFGNHVLYPVYMPTSNSVNQVHWDTPVLQQFFEGADIALLNHEMLAIPVQRLFPKLRIVTMCNLRPDNPLYWESMRQSDLVVMQGKYAAEQVRQRMFNATHWSLAYDERLMPNCAGSPRPIDVLFIQRCSASNYTHHEEFLAAHDKHFSHLRVKYVDVTGYLRHHRLELLYSTSESYISDLRSAKVAVALNDNWYGGLSIREAVRCGCTPLVLNAPCYMELVGQGWPYVVSNLAPESLAERVLAAVANWNDPKLPVEAYKNACSESYQAGWPKVKKDLEALCSSR